MIFFDLGIGKGGKIIWLIGTCEICHKCLSKQVWVKVVSWINIALVRNWLL